MFCKLSANQFGGLYREGHLLYRVAQGHYELAKKLYLKLGVRNGVFTTNHVGTDLRLFQQQPASADTRQAPPRSEAF